MCVDYTSMNLTTYFFQASVSFPIYVVVKMKSETKQNNDSNYNNYMFWRRSHVFLSCRLTVRFQKINKNINFFD